MKTATTSPSRTPRSFFGVLILVLGLSLTLMACAEEETETLENGIGGEPTTDISDLEGDAAQYMGRTVRVDGQVESVYGSNAFTITGGLFTGDLPVILPADVSTQAGTVAEGDELQVTGTVRAFVATEIETEYGLDLMPEFETEVEESEPVLIAESVTRAETGMPMQDGMDEGQQQTDPGM